LNHKFCKFFLLDGKINYLGNCINYSPYLNLIYMFNNFYHQNTFNSFVNKENIYCLLYKYHQNIIKSYHKLLYCY